AGIYSSPDGLEWIRKELPETHSSVEEIQFFDDGTPVARTITDEHVIRRGDRWYYLRIPSQQSGVEATFIRDDTLFAYGARKFAYSIDKGITFTTLFTAVVNITSHTAHVWASDSYLALHHSVGSTNYLSVFNRS